MVMKSCRVCGHLTNGTPTCNKHKPIRDQRRRLGLTRQQQGFDSEYDRNRRIVIERAWAAHERCCLCNQPFATKSEITAEHIVPRRYGGTSALANLGPAHAHCNFGWNRAHNAVRP